MCNCNRRCKCNSNCNQSTNYKNRITSCGCRNVKSCSDCEIYANICENSIYKSNFPENSLYGHAYTPNQTLTNIFVPEVGLNNGTMFPELVSPYYPGDSMEFINYLKQGGVHCE